MIIVLRRKIKQEELQRVLGGERQLTMGRPWNAREQARQRLGGKCAR